MSQIHTHGRTNNCCLGFEPGNVGTQSMCFQTNERSDRQTDMVALRCFETILSTLNARKLREAAMVNFDLPGIQSIKGSLLKGHIQTAGCPVFRVAVCADSPKNLNPAISLEVNQTSVHRNEDLADRTVSATIGANLPIALELGQPVPFEAAQQFEIGQAAIPTVKGHRLRLKAALLGLLDHVLKVVVLAQTIFNFVVKSEIAWQPTLAVG